MQWPGREFYEHCLARPLTPNSARSYVSYLRNLDRVLDGLDAVIESKRDHIVVVQSVEGMPAALFGKSSDKRNSLSALRVYLDFQTSPQQLSVSQRPDPFTAPQTQAVPFMAPHAMDSHKLSDLFHDVRSLALRYRAATGKPLGVTGELAELAASQILGVQLAPARTAGFDGWLERDGQQLRVQVKGRAVTWATRYIGRCPAIKCGNQFDIVLLVLIDNETMQPREIWEANEASILVRLSVPGSKSRNERSSLGISQFKSVAKLIWSSTN